MARFFVDNENRNKLFVLAPQTADNDDDANFLVRYNTKLVEIFSSIQQEPLEIETNTIASTDCNSQSAGPIEYHYKGTRRIVAGHIQFRSEAQAERAYALFNDTSIIVAKTSKKSRRRLRLELLYHKTTEDNDNTLLPPLLHIRGVPATVQTWFPETFSIFREYGQLIKCQRRHRCAIHQNNLLKACELCTEKHDPTIIVQYVSKQESDRAISELNGSIIFEHCIMSIIVKDASATPPEKSSSDHTKKPPSSSKTNISTTGHVQKPHDSSSPSSPIPSSKNSSSGDTIFQQQQQQQQRSTQHRGQRKQQQRQMTADEKPTALSSPTATSSSTKQRLELKPAMDLCNIYVKHIDPSIKSTGLFNLFKPFGRIISARVMEDPATGESRGFGFVSYSHPTEAAAALLEMDGYVHVKESSTTKTAAASQSYSLNSDKKEENEDHNDEKKQQQQQWTSEPMSVRFHEPRVPRPERDYQQQVTKLFQSHLAGQFSFEHVLLAIADTVTSSSGGASGSGSGTVAEVKTSGSGLVHHHQQQQQQQQHHHHHRGHHHPVPPPLMMPPPSPSYYTPYSPSPTHQTPSSQPVSPFTLQHHHYMFPHSPYLVPHSPSASTNPYYYYYHQPQQQPITMAEYFSPSPPPPSHIHTLSSSMSPTASHQPAIHYHSQIQQQHYQHHHYQHQQRPSRYQQQQKSRHQQKTEAFVEGDNTKKGAEQQQQEIVEPVTSGAEVKEEAEHVDDRITESGISESSSIAEAIGRTASPPDGGRQRLHEVVQQRLSQVDNAGIDTVVDTLMAALSRKERSLCLFNEEYLQHRINQVLERQQE